MSKNLIHDSFLELERLKAEGLFKPERIIVSSQDSEIKSEGREVINLCANNYLGLANHPDLIATAKTSLDSHGFGMASVRFICGTQDLHKTLESEIAAYLDTEDCILFPSCFDANGGLFEPLLGPEDAIISDSLNHASIIDGVRLCKAQRYRYKNNDIQDLEQQLKAAKDARYRLIVTDGVFSMDGTLAKLPAIYELAQQYDALVMVDDCHATGVVGETGAGTPEFFGLKGKIDLLTGTLGKALGGASGGYVAGPRSIVGVLKQKARPYLFSNAVAPAICAASIQAIALSKNATDRRQKMHDNAQRFRQSLVSAGFDLIPGNHPIIPVMIGDAAKAAEMAEKLLDKGVYVIAFSYPVVPKGMARIRTQISAAHTAEQIDFAAKAFIEVGIQLGLIEESGQ